MTFRRVTIDNSVKYIPQSEKDSKPKTIKNNSNPRKNISQNKKIP